LEIASLRGELRRILRARDYAAACAVLSNLLEMELLADWDPHMEALVSWAKQLNAAQGFHRWSAKGEWPSVEVVVQPGDSLVKIRKRVIRDRPELNICTGLIARANQLPDANSIRPGQVLRVPLEPVRTVVDLSARFLLYYHGDEVVCAWPVAIGRDGLTLPGEYTVKDDKKKEPAWFYPGDFVPKDERERSEGYLPYGHPENPLGTRWMGWKGSQGLAFHGTWEPETIGTAASKGCIRLSNRDVEELFEILPVGTTIQVHP
jgi:lipoprotein-anchoring transpeptidase ErfK/SrfK